jgi:hypothetical protein
MGLSPATGGNWILSVGATPTAHAATQIEQGNMDLEGVLELYVTLLYFEIFLPYTSYTLLVLICFEDTS